MIKTVLLMLVLLNCIATISQNLPALNLRLSTEVQWSTIEGKPTVYYELYLTSLSLDTIRLHALNVINTKNSSLLYSVIDTGWQQKTKQFDTPSHANVLAPGNTTIVFLEYTLPSVSTAVLHELSMEIKGNTQLISGAEFSISTQLPLILGAPLEGGPWAAIYHPDWQRGHRRVIYTIDNKARIPGRYAIDFILLNERGHYSKGDENEIRNWYGYAFNVLAVKDGVISSVRDDFKESSTLKNHPDYTADQATGNFVSIAIGDGNFVFYEHLKPGSIRVKPGQKVKKGQVIAAIGFTGQTTGPHLHFHVADADSPLGAEGLAFVFEKIISLGSYNHFEDFGKDRWTSLPKGEGDNKRFKERPAPNAVIRFD